MGLPDADTSYGAIPRTAAPASPAARKPQAPNAGAWTAQPARPGLVMLSPPASAACPQRPALATYPTHPAGCETRMPDGPLLMSAKDVSSRVSFPLT